MIQQGFTIHTRAHNERTGFAVFLSQYDGIISTPIQSKQRLHYFTPYQIIRNGKRIVVQETLTGDHSLKGKKLYCGLYLNELIYRFCKPKDPLPEIYECYAQALSQLRQLNTYDHILRKFELSLITLSGYGMNIDSISTPYVAFSVDHGLTEAYQANQNTIPTEALLDIDNLDYNQERKSFFRHILNKLLSSNIQSRIFYEELH
tara:strand:- start:81 stop:692 length:612 start_codon:yes stop_codon:yes gene_type:complete